MAGWPCASIVPEPFGPLISDRVGLAVPGLWFARPENWVQHCWRVARPHPLKWRVHVARADALTRHSLIDYPRLRLALIICTPECRKPDIGGAFDQRIGRCGAVDQRIWRVPGGAVQLISAAAPGGNGPDSSR